MLAVSRQPAQPLGVEGLVGEQEVRAESGLRHSFDLAGVAAQNAVWPASDRRRANAVDLNALTCGRNDVPGQRPRMASTLRSNAARSTTRAGVRTAVK